MTPDNRALWELVEADREYDAARAAWWETSRYDEDSYGVPGSEFYICRGCENESGAGILNKGVIHEAGCAVEALEMAEAKRAKALAAVSILERPVVVGDEDVERAWSVLDDALNGKLDGNEYAYGDPFPMRAALESMVRGKS